MPLKKAFTAGIHTVKKDKYMSAEFHKQEPLPILDRMKNRFPIRTPSLDAFADRVKGNDCLGIEARVQEMIISRRLLGLAGLPESLRLTYRFETRYEAETIQRRKIIFDEQYGEVPEGFYAHHAHDLLAQCVITAQHRLLRLRGQLPNLPQTISVYVSGQKQEADLTDLAEYARAYNIVPFPVSR